MVGVQGKAKRQELIYGFLCRANWACPDTQLAGWLQLHTRILVNTSGVGQAKTAWDLKVPGLWPVFGCQNMNALHLSPERFS